MYKKGKIGFCLDPGTKYERTTSFLPSFPNIRKNLESSAWPDFYFLKVIKKTVVFL